jgi:hypothetical protein
MSKSVSSITNSEIVVAARKLAAISQGGTFSTIDIIREITGRYERAAGTPASSSPNAAFGKRLSQDSQILGIKREPPKSHPQKDDSGAVTSTARWRLV